MTSVIDSSAVFAILRNEIGGPAASKLGHGALLSAVNLSETLAKASDFGIPPAAVANLIGRLEISVVAFDEQQAIAAASFRPITRFHRVSLGDRACLGLAKVRNVPIVTADSKWAELDLDLDIRMIR